MSQVEELDVDQGKKEEDEETQYVAVEDPPEGEEDVEQRVDDDGDDDEEEDQQDSRLAGNAEDDEDDKRERRRQENKSRRQRQKEARDRTERELKFLRDRNETLERRFSELEQNVDQRVAGSELAGIDTQINRAKSDLQLANQVIEQAIEANNGKDVAEAMDHRDTIRDNLRDLEQAREYLTTDRQPQQAPPELDPRHVAHAQSFMIDHDWWDPAGRDPESQQVLMIDRALVQEGYNPIEKSYWDELRNRVSNQFPDRFDAQGGDDDIDDDGGEADTGNGRQPRQQERRRGQGGPQFRSGGRERPLKPNEVYISPERKEAMIEAGVWDDPVLRNQYLASYARYDREQAEGA